MTLNGTIALILRYFIEFGRFGADYVKVVENTGRSIVWDKHVGLRTERIIYGTMILPEATETEYITDRHLRDNECTKFGPQQWPK